jgi:hypothetical protein
LFQHEQVPPPAAVCSPTSNIFLANRSLNNNSTDFKNFNPQFMFQHEQFPPPAAVCSPTSDIFLANRSRINN